MSVRVIHAHADMPAEAVLFYREQDFVPVWGDPELDRLTAPMRIARHDAWARHQGGAAALRRGDVLLVLDPGAARTTIDLRTSGADGTSQRDPSGNLVLRDATIAPDRPEAVDTWHEVGGASVHRRHWPSPDPATATLRLLHGARAHTGWWARMLALAPAHVEALAMDQSGHGLSDHRDSYDIDTWVDEVAAVLLASDQPVSLTGHSIGGRLAVMTAARYPESVRSLTLVDTGVYALKITTAPPARTYDDLASAMPRFRLLPPQPWPAGGALQTVAAQSLRELPGGRYTWRFDPESLMTLRDGRFADDLAQIRCPIHLVRGAFSDVARAGDADIVHAASGAPVTDVVIPGGYHHLPLDSARQLLEVLLQIERGEVPAGARVLA